jgi:hypothetical protein
LASDWLGLANLKKFGTRFRGQVWPGEVLKLAGKIVKVTDAPGGGKAVDAELTVTNEAGELKVQAWASAVLPA